MEKIKSAIWQMITEPNNKTVCPVRLMAIAGFIQFCVMAAWNLRHHGHFDMQEAATSFAVLIGGIGAALGLKKDSPGGER